MYEPNQSSRYSSGAAMFRGICLIASVVLLAFPSAACAGGTSATPPSAGPAASKDAGLPEPRNVDELRGMKIQAFPLPDWTLAAAGSVWIAGIDPGLRRYDARTGQDRGGLPITSVCQGMDYGFDSVWVTSCTYDQQPTVARIDGKTGQSIASIPLPARPVNESSLAAGEGAVWLLTSGNARDLVEIDPRTNIVSRVLPAPLGASAVRAGFGAVWASVAVSGSLVRIDPDTGNAVATVAVGRGAQFLAVGSDSVWVMNVVDGTVSRVDPQTNTVVATIKVSAQSIHGGDITVSGEAVWARVTQDALAVRIDPKVNAVVDRLGPPAGSGGIAIADASLWVTAHDIHAVWRLPRT